MNRSNTEGKEERERKKKTERESGWSGGVFGVGKTG